MPWREGSLIGKVHQSKWALSRLRQFSRLAQPSSTSIWPRSFSISPSRPTNPGRIPPCSMDCGAAQAWSMRPRSASPAAVVRERSSARSSCASSSEPARRDRRGERRPGGTASASLRSSYSSRRSRPRAPSRSARPTRRRRRYREQRSPCLRQPARGRMRRGAIPRPDRPSAAAPLPGHGIRAAIAIALHAQRHSRS